MFALDLQCGLTCNGPLMFIAAIEHAAVIEILLTPVKLTAHPPPRVPARYDPADEADVDWNPATPPKSVH